MFYLRQLTFGDSQRRRGSVSFGKRHGRRYAEKRERNLSVDPLIIKPTTLAVSLPEFPLPSPDLAVSGTTKLHY